MAGVFLSYRRTDSAGWAGRLRDHLVLRYGVDSVWQDVDDLTIGSEYLTQILRNIDEADAVLILIGPHWLERRARSGKTRLADQNDVLRMEIARALKRKSGVIPTLVGGASMPKPTELPRPVAPLVKRNGIAIIDADWARSVELLLERLQDLSRAARASGKRRITTLDETLAKLDALQDRYFEQLEADPRGAATIARKALGLLDDVMPSYPHDRTLQLFRGFFLKNLAMAQRDAGDSIGCESSLKLAAKCFEVVQREAELHLANAYTGSASVPALRGDGAEALKLIQRALELVPDHRYARRDREELRRVFGL